MAKARLKILDFLSQIQKNPLLQNNKFEVDFAGTVNPINGQGNSISFDSRLNSQLNTYLIQTNLPGRTIGTAEIREHGPLRKVPLDVTYSGLTMTFYLDSDKVIYNKFTDWTEAVAQTKPDKATGGIDFGGQLKVGFYNDYAKNTSAIIHILDSKTLERTISVKYNEVYPFQIDDIPLDKNLTDGLIQYSVQFAYRGLEVL